MEANEFMNDVCVIGLGYIGLPTAVVAAKSGLKVVGFDINSDLIAAINNRSFEVAEHGLLDELNTQMDSGNLVVSDKVTAAGLSDVSVRATVCCCRLIIRKDGVNRTKQVPKKLGAAHFG